MQTPTDTIRYGTHDDQFVHRYRPSTRPIGTIVAIHGGYWRERYDLSTAVPLCEHLVASGWTVLNVEYRRVGRARAVWPEMSADILAAVALSDVRPVVAIGHSAGGQLALWAAAQPDAGIDAVVALAPVADLSRPTNSISATAQHAPCSADRLPNCPRSTRPLHRGSFCLSTCLNWSSTAMTTMPCRSTSRSTT